MGKGLAYLTFMSPLQHLPHLHLELRPWFLYLCWSSDVEQTNDCIQCL